MFFSGGLLLFYLLQWTADWIWGYFTRNPSEFYITVGAAVAALMTSIYLYRHERVQTLANEVASELKKVAWPSAKDVKQATIVVVIMTLISALILGSFDLVWGAITKLIYE